MFVHVHPEGRPGDDDGATGEDEEVDGLYHHRGHEGAEFLRPRYLAFSQPRLFPCVEFDGTDAGDDLMGLCDAHVGEPHCLPTQLDGHFRELPLDRYLG